MALHFGRLMCQKQFTGYFFRGLPYASSRFVGIKAAPAPSHCNENYDERNARLKRPQSPHLSIYKLQLTTFMSVTHRATGMALGTYLSALGIGALVSPWDFPVIAEFFTNLHLPSILIMSGKAAVAFPVAFHFANGCRHLSWDLGQFLTIKEVYLTGYLTLAFSVLLTAWFVYLGS